MMNNNENDDLILADEEDDLILADDEPIEGNKETPSLKTNSTIINPAATHWKVIIVDDEPEIHQVIKLVLRNVVFEGKRLFFISAYSGEEGKSLLEKNPDSALLFLDVVMEKNDSGLQFAKYVRDTLHNSFVRIILHTGQPGEAPEESVIMDYDINDYKIKSDMTDLKLFVTTMVGLRSYRDLIALEASKVLLKDKNDQLQEEITKRQQVENELRDHRDNLENLVAKRTNELAKVNVLLQEDIARREQIEKELIRSKEAAEAANNAKSTFIYNISHEFRTPLNGILGYTSLLKDDEGLKGEQKEDIQIIQNCGEHLLTLIDDVLDLSKIEAGKLELIPKPFRFPDLLKNVVNFFSIRAKQKGIELVYDSPSQLPNIALADSKRLRQILLNLLSNAIKFTHKGQVTFKVSYQHAPTSSQEEKNQIRFEVEDSGEGIAAENFEVIFLPFQQLAKQYQQVDGTGLGLSISKTLVEMMGGKLQVQSELGIGSHFWFEIPLQDYFETNLQLEEWIDHSSQNSEVVAPKIIPPDVKKIEALFKFARMGNMSTVIEKAEALENNSNLQAFTQTVCQLAKQYELYKLKAFLQQYLPSTQEKS